MTKYIRSNQNNEQFKIFNINKNTAENRNDLPFFEVQQDNSNITLESHNTSLINNFPIFKSEEKKNINNETDIEISQTIVEQLFYVEKIANLNNSLKKRFKIIKRKRGREKLKHAKLNEQENERIHDKNASDNLLIKIQVNYFTFIIKFLNEVLKILNYKQRFSQLAYPFKRNVKKVFVNSLKTKTIGEIICNKISNKYKNDHYDNKFIYEQLKEDKILNKIFSENYLFFFKKIYFKSERTVNLREYGLNKKIILSNKVKMYKDLLKDKECEYKKNIIKCVNHHFFPNSLFKVEYI